MALARALAIEPEVVLLDEPFSSLDAALRASVRQEVAEILRARGTTTVLVTHDQDEALSMADRVAVLRDGRIVADARPEDLYRSPLDADLAGFLGEANLLPGTIEGGVARTALGRLVLQDEVSAGWPGSDPAAVVLVRPEQLEVRSRTAVPAGGGIAARVVDRAFFGHDAVLRVVPSSWPTASPLLVRVTGPGAPAARHGCPADGPGAGDGLAGGPGGRRGRRRRRRSRRAAPTSSRGSSAAEGRGQHHAQAVQVVELLLDGLAPGGEILVEMGPVAVLERVFQLVERGVLGVEQGSVASQELVVDHVRQRHVSYLPEGVSNEASGPAPGLQGAARPGANLQPLDGRPFLHRQPPAHPPPGPGRRRLPRPGRAAMRLVPRAEGGSSSWTPPAAGRLTGLAGCRPRSSAGMSSRSLTISKPESRAARAAPSRAASRRWSRRAGAGGAGRRGRSRGGRWPPRRGPTSRPGPGRRRGRRCGTARASAGRRAGRRCSSEAPDAAAAASAISRVPPSRPPWKAMRPTLAGPHRPLDDIGMGQQLAPGGRTGGFGDHEAVGLFVGWSVSTWSGAGRTRAPGPGRPGRRPGRTGGPCCR